MHAQAWSNAMAQEFLLSNTLSAPSPARRMLSFSLPPLMTIDTAKALCDELKQLTIGQTTCLTLDASRVENITTPGLQLIIALQKSLAQENGQLILDRQPNLFAQALADTGLAPLLASAIQIQEQTR